MTAAKLLGEVLARARETVGRSPEQVGEQTGVHGRTIRRLEDGDSRRPRRTTLQALASFYGLDGEFLGRLAGWSTEGADSENLERLVLARAREQLGEEVIAELDEQEEGDLLVVVAMRLARRHVRGSASSAALARGVAAASAEQEELAVLVDAIVSLDRRRRRMAGELLVELRRAQTAEQALRRRGRMSIAADDAAGVAAATAGE